MRRCDRHPSAMRPADGRPAPFYACPKCATTNCEGCVRSVPAGTRPLLLCTTCGEPVRPLAPEGEGDLREILTRPFSRDGLLTAAAFTAPHLLSGLRLVGILFFMIYLAALSAYFFRVVDHVGQARSGLPFSEEDVMDRWEMGGAFVRGALVLGVVSAPLYLARRSGVEWLGPLSLAWTIAVLPAAALAVAVSRSSWAALWPPLWARVIALAPGPYLALVGLMVVLGAVTFAAFFGALMTVASVTFVGSFTLAFVVNLGVMMQACALGAYLSKHATVLGYGEAPALT